MGRSVGIVAITVVLLAIAPAAYAAPGDVDPTFGVGGKLTVDLTPRADFAWTVAWEADGTIVAAGETGTGGHNPRFVVARYDADGSLDTTFGGDGSVTTDFTPGEDLAYSVAVQPDGKIVAAGTAGYSEFALARYNIDGSLDTTFGGDGTVTTEFTHGEDFAFFVAIQPDGAILAGGDALGKKGAFALARYNPDGSLDPSFGGDGKVTTDFTSHPDDLLALAIQPDGKIVAAGGGGFDAVNEKFALARYNADGTLDTSFGGDGKVTTDFTPHPDVVFSLRLQADGRIIAAGGASLGVKPRFALARYDTDGSVDTSFGGDGKVTTDFVRGADGDDDAYSVDLQPDGKIVAAGQAGGTNFNTKFALARYNADGTLDTSFGEGGKVITNLTDGYDGAYAVAIRPDGKILAGGPSGPTKLGLVRYLSA